MSPVARRIASLLGVRPDTPPLPDPTPHPPCSMILTVVFVLKSWGPRTDLFSTVSGGSHHGLIFLRDEIVLEKSGRRVINEDKMCVNSLHSRATREKKQQLAKWVRDSLSQNCSSGRHVLQNRSVYRSARRRHRPSISGKIVFCSHCE